MSRIGRMPIIIPDKVDVFLKKGSLNTSGVFGDLKISIHPIINIIISKNIIFVKRKSETLLAKSMHGTTRNLIYNMIYGVSIGFKKELQIIGVGYKAEILKSILILHLGFSHLVNFKIPELISISLDKKNNRIKLFSINKQALGDTAAKIRLFRPPEPYKGKGIRYRGEIIKIKEGKSTNK
jgi:large subunit ribosomal protein L6